MTWARGRAEVQELVDDGELELVEASTDVADRMRHDAQGPCGARDERDRSRSGRRRVEDLLGEWRELKDSRWAPYSKRDQKRRTRSILKHRVGQSRFAPHPSIWSSPVRSG